jgi:hypothetical protein
MAHSKEARRGCLPARASVVAWTADARDITTEALILKRFHERFGLPPDTARVIASLAGLGPKEA